MGKQYGETIIYEVLKMKADGLSHREIGKKYGLRKEQIRELLKRHNRKERQRAKGVEIRPKGRPRTRSLSNEQQKELEIKHLRAENELLRSFLQAAGRR